VTLAALGGVVAAFAAVYRVAGVPLMANVLAFAGNVNQGFFAEGWRLPFAYLWHAEHLLLLVWLLAFGWCVWHWRAGWADRTIRAGLVGASCIYLCLFIGSVALTAFVVYGRLARQLVPFFCLLTAATIERSVTRDPDARRRLVAAAALALAVHVFVTFRGPMRQQFPAQFVREAERLAADAGARELLLANAHHIYPRPEPFEVPPGFSLLAAAPHPLQFRPYQYEGFDPSERLALHEADIRMRAYITGR
jgi:hypothetical protein